jgi:hypothetical protein
MSEKLNFGPKICVVSVLEGEVLVKRDSDFDTFSGQTSGFYYDNGFQHVRERLLSRQEQTQMQHKILNMLGLPKAPLGEAALPALNLSMHHHAVDKRAAAPKFLMDVYRTLLDEEQHLNPSKTEFEMTGTDIHAMHESDVIMSFTNQGLDCSQKHKKK